MWTGFSFVGNFTRTFGASYKSHLANLTLLFLLVQHIIDQIWPNIPQAWNFNIDSQMDLANIPNGMLESFLANIPVNSGNIRTKKAAQASHPALSGFAALCRKSLHDDSPAQQKLS
jgi:hypothetical protein